MRRPNLRKRLAALGAGTALATLASMGTATAAEPQLNGAWEPFTRCPVDAPAMLATDGLAQVPQCVVSHSAGGSIKLGNTTVTTGATNLQFGVVQNSDGTNTVVAPPAGSIIADSAYVPGGMLGLMCPSDIPVISYICGQIENGAVNGIEATVESVGTPSDYNQVAAILTGQTIVSIPVRVKLENPFLGDNCYIGSASEPIILQPQNTVAPSVGVERFNGDGSANPAGEMSRLNLAGATQADTTFSVPGATGCGLDWGLINSVVNLKTGLPSPSGNNSLVLNNAQTHLGGFFAAGTHAPNAGRLLSDNWHSAVQQ
ncbi:hypothetical protein [Streptomyces sp. KLOTTS4A1]|uniref:hypothetical protein n=1 Tax=Streptomyces sp. KLOTTS4A1 TaxID=3390996 RepID=UPI0039F5C22B